MLQRHLWFTFISFVLTTKRAIMNHRLIYVMMLSFCISCGTQKSGSNKGWKSLFDGKTLNGWRVGQNAETFSVDSGMIIVHGKASHLFYIGDSVNNQFKNFHFKAQVKTTPGSNSGIYFHTKYQGRGWPEVGYEVQVNNSQSDWRRTGSLYGFEDVREQHVKDNEWYTQEIIVQGKNVQVKLNGKPVVNYTEPQDFLAAGRKDKRRIASGTFALQGHDPNSRVYYKDIVVKKLPD